MTVLRRFVPFAVMVALAACSGGGDAAAPTTAAGESTTTTEASTTTTEESTTTTEGTTTTFLPNLPVGQTYGPFDLNDDHVPDAMCGPKDFGGGLVLLRFCDAAGFASTPGDGITLVPDSLFSWPTRNE